MKDGLLLNYHSFVGKTHFKLPAFFCPLIPSKQQFPEAMTCPCSWRPSREGPRGLLGPVLPTEEGRSRFQSRITNCLYMEFHGSDFTTYFQIALKKDFSNLRYHQHWMRECQPPPHPCQHQGQGALQVLNGRQHGTEPADRDQKPTGIALRH
ncbi:uncharacterized protein LOC113909858 isoform X2 [Zalophus californianus]|uniref:Uncharacterized protein LOC113909858 isoform X2 n=1 Tax=Zalophus californianus TaxID=9704 RepID=A0A6J2B5J2_ZALCA|nr:uncharacterized protein LOC113909858 isoform X2 [Zalophus californianus]